MWPITIVNDDSRVVNKVETLLTDDARVVIHDHHMFIVKATALSGIHTRNHAVHIVTFARDSKKMKWKFPNPAA